MKTLNHFLYGVALNAAAIFLPTQVFAEVVQYQFSTYGAPNALSTLGISPGGETNILSGTFSLDHGATTDGVIHPGAQLDFVTFAGALQNVDLSFDSTELFSLQTPVGNAHVADKSFTTNYVDALFLALWYDGTGTYNIGDYALEGITLNFMDNEFLDGSSLPPNLTTLGLTPWVDVYFRDQQGQRVGITLGNATISEVSAVPLPASGWLFASALLLLRRKAH